MDQQSMETPGARMTTPLEGTGEPATLEASSKQGTGRRRLVLISPRRISWSRNQKRKWNLVDP